ncbi:MAG: terminase small subunit [Dehalococcoidales bacterium]|nr:terminase small subunit [Dehalococcoidales bacterium]
MTVPGRGGRPRKWKTPELMQAAIEEYFRACDEHVDREGKPDPEPYTVTGLAVHLGMTRQELIQYGGDGDFQPGDDAAQIQAYSDVLKSARARIEADVEGDLRRGKGHPAGSIFWLKNAGWTDQLQISVDSPVIVVRPPQVEGDPD